MFFHTWPPEKFQSSYYFMLGSWNMEMFYTVRPWDLRDSIPSRQDTWGHLGGWQRALRFTTWCISDIVVKGWNKRFQWIKRSARIKPNGDVWYLLKKLPCQILEASLAALAWEKVQSANGCRRRFECRACWCFVGPKSWRVLFIGFLRGGCPNGEPLRIPFGKIEKKLGKIRGITTPQ